MPTSRSTGATTIDLENRTIIIGTPCATITTFSLCGQGREVLANGLRIVGARRQSDIAIGPDKPKHVIEGTQGRSDDQRWEFVRQGLGDTRISDERETRN